MPCPAPEPGSTVQALRVEASFCKPRRRTDMPARNELDLLAGSRPAILDRAAEVMDEAEEERLLQLILQSSPDRSPIFEGPRRALARPRNIFAVAAAVVLLTGLAAFAVRQQPGG